MTDILAQIKAAFTHLRIEDDSEEWESPQPVISGQDKAAEAIAAVFQTTLTLRDAQVAVMVEALTYVFETADFYQYELGMHNGSTDEGTQTKHYICFGCDAKGWAKWPLWEKIHFEHDADCQYLKARLISNNPSHAAHALLDRIADLEKRLKIAEDLYSEVGRDLVPLISVTATHHVGRGGERLSSLVMPLVEHLIKRAETAEQQVAQLTATQRTAGSFECCNRCQLKIGGDAWIAACPNNPCPLRTKPGSAA